jgi:hypothetical protein
LSLEDVSCKEAWMKLSTNNISLPVNVELIKDTSLNQTINLTTADTILYVDSLLPNQTYSFHTSIQSYNNSGEVNSNDLNVNTLDTTSNDFTWQTWTFGGEAGSCALYDVAIVNDTSIYAVGEIYLLDSTGVPDPNAYNAVYWNGYQWKVERIKYYGSCSAVEFPPLKAIWAFSDSEIVVTNGGSIGWLNGNTAILDCDVQTLLNGAINKIWGTSKNDFYIVGNTGSIAHYQNSHWTKIESGTSLNIHDIWGYRNDSDGSQLILGAASDFGTDHEKKLLLINSPNQVDTVSWGLNRTLATVWFDSKYKIYVGGSGVLYKSNNEWKEETSVPHYFTIRIRGNALNDIYSTGSYYLAHYNGYSWKDITDPSLSGVGYYSLAVKGNICCAVGFIGAQAVITLVNRN